MCRLVAYVGSGALIEDVIINPPHNLIIQSYDSRELMDGKVNVDGFGCCWYNLDVSDRPAVYATLLPPWADRNFPTIARAVKSNLIFSAIRNATPPLPTEIAAVQPLNHGRYAFVHNGFVKNLTIPLRRAMIADLPDEYFGSISGSSDSAILFAAVLWLLSKEKDDSLALKRAMLSMVDWLGVHLEKHGGSSALNIGLTDGMRAVFLRHDINAYCNSLYYNKTHPDFMEGALVASEAFDDDEGWKGVPENSVLLVSSKGEIEIETIQ